MTSHYAIYSTRNQFVLLIMNTISPIQVSFFFRTENMKKGFVFLTMMLNAHMKFVIWLNCQ